MAGQEDINRLIARVALSDRQAFAELYDATSAKLMGVTLRVLKDRAVAEDALQDVYVKIWRNADRYTARGLSPMTWLITIARNTAIDRLRARRETGGGMDLIEALPSSGPTPEDSAIARSEAVRIAGCMKELAPDHREAVRGAYLEGHTYADLANRHNVPLNTIRTWLRRSLRTLRDCLSR